ncbi:hypothetical protein FRC07_014716, partial [Ceratobasidium sp. 392]
MLPQYSKTVSCLILRKFESLVRRLKTLRERSKTQRARFDKRLEGESQLIWLSSGIHACFCAPEARSHRTADALAAVSLALIEWRKTAIETLEDDDPPFLDRERALKALWEELGFVIEQGAGKATRTPRAAKSSSISPSNSEMEAAFQYYIEEYCNSLTAREDLPIPAMSQTDCVIDLGEEDVDLGVDHLKDWTIERLWASLGLPGATQFPFAEPGRESLEGSALPSKPKICPRWHQIVGVHAILEGAFTAKTGDRARPTMLCDDVGLGKTLQIIGVVSWLAHSYEQQELPENRRLPPAPFTVENGTPYFAGLPKVPCLPSVIVVPTTLSSQWIAQLFKFTQQGSFSLVRYSSDQGSLEDFFTNPAGAYRKAAGLKLERAHRTIIVADSS